MTNDVNQREIVLDVLLEINKSNTFSHIVINQALSKYQYLDKSNRAFISMLTQGTIERSITLDYIINQFSNVKTNKMKPLIRYIIRMSVYQIMYMDAIPDSAICNEAVKLTMKRGFFNLKGFVNGVLRNIARQKEDIKYPDASKFPILSLSVKYSMPEWIIEKWIGQIGYEETCIVLNTMINQDKKTCVRCNVNKKPLEQIIKMLTDEKINYEVHPYDENTLYIDGYNYISSIKAFKEGYIQIQDISSVLAVKASGAKKGDYCIDICAAPGGKSIYLADLINNTGVVDARDISSYKVDLINENISRSGHTNIITSVKNALIKDEDSINKADILIADLPCSGLGIIGKKPDIKFNILPENLVEIRKLQRDILSVINEYVKPGKTLIYSTCTINKEENEENFNWLIDNFDFEAVSLEDIFDQNIKEFKDINTIKKGYIQLLPGIHKSDGFFISKLRRKDK